jgi:hypothetical protein
MRGNDFLSFQNWKDGAGAYDLVMKFLAEQEKECVVVVAEIKGPTVYVSSSFL